MEQSVIERFWKYVDRDSDPRGCWLWTGAKFHFGHGAFRGEGSAMIRAHRFSWLLHRGQIPDGLCVLHTCDNPSCVNPLHLFLGTKTLNSIDCTAKRRQARGEANANAKFSAETVREIRRLRKAGVMTKELAQGYSVNRSTIQRIVRKATWKQVE